MLEGLLWLPKWSHLPSSALLLFQPSFPSTRHRFPKASLDLVTLVLKKSSGCLTDVGSSSPSSRWLSRAPRPQAPPSLASLHTYVGSQALQLCPQHTLSTVGAVLPLPFQLLALPLGALTSHPEVLPGHFCSGVFFPLTCPPSSVCEHRVAATRSSYSESCRSQCSKW